MILGIGTDLVHKDRIKAIYNKYDKRFTDKVLSNLEKKEFKKLKNVEFSNSIQESIKGSDIVIIHTEWNDFKSINFKKFSKNKKLIIYDMRNIYSPDKIKKLGFKYFGIGR